jgi:hypothetical protein
MSFDAAIADTRYRLTKGDTRKICQKVFEYRCERADLGLKNRYFLEFMLVLGRTAPTEHVAHNFVMDINSGSGGQKVAPRFLHCRKEKNLSLASVNKRRTSATGGVDPEILPTDVCPLGAIS